MGFIRLGIAQKVLKNGYSVCSIAHISWYWFKNIERKTDDNIKLKIKMRPELNIYRWYTGKSINTNFHVKNIKKSTN